MHKLNILLLFLFSVTGLVAQNSSMKFTGVPTQPENVKALETQFEQFEHVQFDATQLKKQLEGQEEVLFSLQLGEKTWDLHLLRMESRHRLITINGKDGKRTYPARNQAQVWRGYLRRDPTSTVSLTINDGFLYGMIIEKDEMFFIEPAEPFTKVSGQNFVVYNALDVKADMKDFCGVGELEKGMNQYAPDHDDHEHAHDHGNAETRSMMGCRELELAIAADFAMFQKYGSATGVQNRIDGVLANVQTNYDNEFNDEIAISTVEYFISNCSTCDPWTSSNSAGALLNSFRSWGQSGGFSVPFDLAGIWTNRNFSGSTIGIAFLSSVCFSTRYHAIQDFSNNAQVMRVLVSHEIGHNFSAQHDASGAPFIMAPSVNTSNAWSTASQNSINSFYPGLNCLGSCFVPIPPVADFTADFTEGCFPFTVDFTDLSQNSPTSWSWLFPGGTPSSSASQNPTVTYNTPGVYPVTLTVTNSAGSDTESKSGYITVNGPPIPDFIFVDVQDTVFFTNITPNGDSFFWSFGDGENSTDENPVHVFPFDGNFDVTLEVTNECGTESITRTITIVTIPVADFTSTNPEGCDSLTVMYTNTSSPNITSVAWEFPGGTPSASTQGNPTVTYRTPGVYDVRLTVSNSRYSVTIERENYVTLGSGPTADFGFLVSDLDVDFSNISINANSYEWDFGDGSGSSMENPSHTYSAGGTYTVQLVAENECGFDTLEQTIVLSSEPVADFSADQTSGCTPLTVNFTSLASNNTTSWNWSFPGGSPASSTAENPSVTYNNAGIYDVSLIVSNGQGSDTLTRSSYISVNSEPSPGFTFFNLGTTIDFINTSSNATSYFWDFGDGSTSTEISPNHEYAGDGNYTVSLTATNECGAGTLVINVPVRTFSASPTEGCDSLTTTFTGPTDGISSYNWSFPGGIPATSTAQNPTVTYSSAGTYDVVLRTTGSAGFLTITETNFITVFDDVPDASFTVSISGSTVTLTNTSTDATEYVWDFDDGTTSTEVNPTHTYAADGDYSILLTATNACGTSSIKTLVTISTLPVADFSADVTNGCTPLTVNFSDASSSTVTSWNWSFPGGTPSSSTAQNPTVTYAAAGTYDVSLIVTNNSGQDTVVRNGYITVDPLPQAGFTFNINGNTVDFTSTSTNATSYSWDFGDGNSSTEENPTHTYSTGGTYVAVLTVTNNCGSSTAEENVVTETPPRGDFTADVTNGCAPLTVNFSDASSPNTTSWSWTFDGGNPSTSSDQNPKVSYTSPGTYDVELIVSNVAGQDVVVKSGYITVEEGPDASFYYNTFGNAVAFVNTSLDADDFFWDFGDGNISTEENPTHFYAFAGTYEVFMTATNECGSTDFSDFVTVSQGGTLVGNQTGNNPTGSSASKTNEKEWLNDFRIYPNPNDGEFQLHLRTSSTFEDVEVKLYNVVGQQVFTQKESVGSGTLNRGYQLNHLPQGTYIFQIVSGDYRAYRKVVIK